MFICTSCLSFWNSFSGSLFTFYLMIVFFAGVVVVFLGGVYDELRVAVRNECETTRELGVAVGVGGLEDALLIFTRFDIRFLRLATTLVVRFVIADACFFCFCSGFRHCHFLSTLSFRYHSKYTEKPSWTMMLSKTHGYSSFESLNSIL